jgi:hypothetical protein
LIGVIEGLALEYTNVVEDDTELLLFRVSAFIIWIFITVRYSIKISDFYDGVH